MEVLFHRNGIISAMTGRLMGNWGIGQYRDIFGDTHYCTKSYKKGRVNEAPKMAFIRYILDNCGEGKMFAGISITISELAQADWKDFCYAYNTNVANYSDFLNLWVNFTSIVLRRVSPNSTVNAKELKKLLLLLGERRDTPQTQNNNA